MLKKLLKYDWILMWRIPAMINLFLVVITLLGIIFLLSPAWQMDDSDSMFFFLTKMLLTFFYIIFLIAGSITIMVYIAVRYYKNIYTDEGYLTNTLPADPWQIVLSKLLVSSVWILITGILVVLSILSLVAANLITMEYATLEDLFIAIPELFDLIADEIDLPGPIIILISIFSAILGSMLNVLIIFSSIALGQLFSKHRVAGAFLWYILQYVIIQFANNLLLNLPVIYYSEHLSYHDSEIITRALWSGQMLGSILLSGLLFFLTEILLRKNLNLE